MKVGGSGVLTAMARTPTGRLEIRWLRKWAHRIMILNEGMRAEALAVHLPADRLVWMPNPVDTEQFSPVPDAERYELRAQHNLPPGAFVIIYTGRLAPEKSLHLLVEAFGTVLRQRAQAYLVFVGDGPMREALTGTNPASGLPGQHLLRRQRGSIGRSAMVADGRRVRAGLAERGFSVRARRGDVGGTRIGGQRHSGKPAAGAAGGPRSIVATGRCLGAVGGADPDV